jgi:rhodanese-related sulfurtransferase
LHGKQFCPRNPPLKSLHMLDFPAARVCPAVHESAQMSGVQTPNGHRARRIALGDEVSVTANRTTVEQLLVDARSGLRRRTAEEAHAEMSGGLRLVDIRSDAQRDADGLIPGAAHVPRNVLEWRLDPACPHRDPDLGRQDVRIALICNEGYQSSLAAATVARFGLREVTDVIGGFQAWRAAGLPVGRPASSGDRSNSPS